MNNAPYQSDFIKQEAIDKVNQACYDNCASQWDRFPFPNLLPGLIKKYFPKNLGNKVLDVGSGTGVLAKYLADQGFDVLCIDPSPEMVSRCQAKGLNTLRSSVQEYNEDTKFSMVFAILSLIHVPKRNFAIQIKKIASFLPAKGILFLALLEGKGEGFSEGSEYPRFFSYFTPEEVEAFTSPYFIRRDYQNVKIGGLGYMLFSLERK